MIAGKHDRSGIALTWAERTVWLASALSANRTAYNAACIVAIEGEIDCARLRAAIRHAVRAGRLAALRITLDHGELTWEDQAREADAFDLALEEPCRAAGMARLENIFRTDPIPADASPLIRVHMIETRADQVLVMFRHHHVLLDFHGNAALARNVAALYGGQAPDPSGVSRREIISAEKAYLASALYEEDKCYWRARLEGMKANALWNALGQQDAGGRFDLAVPAGEVAAFGASVHALGGTPFQALLLIVHAYLCGGRGDDLVFGVPFANRQADRARALVSMSRIVPFRVNVAPGTPVRDALANIRRALKEDLARARFAIWENADHLFGGPVNGALPKVALNYMRASALRFGAATGAITKVLYGERNAEIYIRCIEEADGRLSISIDDADDQGRAESLGHAVHAGIANWLRG
ncbi:MAG: condensation domain-containing protein [Alphaproteobacteria bacterium]